MRGGSACAARSALDKRSQTDDHSDAAHTEECDVEGLEY
nr:hypothetical protein JVH1_3983 [Rhodococcus sp. JVH1]